MWLNCFIEYMWHDPKVWSINRDWEFSTLMEFFPNQAAPRLLQAMQPAPTVPPWVS